MLMMRVWVVMVRRLLYIALLFIDFTQLHVQMEMYGWVEQASPMRGE